jgi:hypothetical protein
MTELNTLSLSLILSLSLVACGGGGSDSTTVATNPGATYVPGAAELGAWNVLQGARTLCGFGALTRNAKLDEAALAHAIYQVNKSFPSITAVLSHYESDDSKLPDLVPDASNIDYTGLYPWDRTTVTGYGNQVAEILMGTRWDYVNPPTFPTMEQRGTESMRSLLNTVYHLAGAMYYGADVGFGAYIDTKMINATWREEYRFGSLNGYQTTTIKLGTGNLATYPCKDSSNIPPKFEPAKEAPNPFEMTDYVSAIVGPPVYLKVDAGQILTVTSVNVSQNDVSVPTTVLTNANDPNIDMYGKKYIGLNEAFVVPLVALIPNTTYTVSLAGTISDVSVSRSFNRSFTMSTGQ